MPHPEQEHALMIEVARLRKERDEALSREARLAAANKALAADVTRCAGIESALAAARRECESWKQIAGDLYTPLDERGFKCDGSHVNVCGTFGAENCPMCLSAALAAPGDGEEGKR